MILLHDAAFKLSILIIDIIILMAHCIPSSRSSPVVASPGCLSLINYTDKEDIYQDINAGNITYGRSKTLRVQP